MTRYIIFVFISLTLVIKAQKVNNFNDSIKGDVKIDLKEDLVKYNGFYTAIESTNGKIPIDKIPQRIKTIKDKPITNIPIQYFQEISNGYILTYKVQFEEYNVLVISTLNKDYIMQDYRTYTDGTGAEIVKNDTIAMITFGNAYVNIEIMHPNKFEEPLFSVDGIRKERLLITGDLLLKKE